MTLIDASPVDRARERRRRTLLLVLVLVGIVVLLAYFYWPYYMARRTVNHFMDALVDHNYQLAYAIWHAKPREYPMDQFMQDWGPASEWGVIKKYHIQQVASPPGGESSGLVVVVRINDIVQQEARIWVEKKTHDLTFYQF
jgi:hypothetical protein